MKGSHLQSGQLLTSFMTTVNRINKVQSQQARHLQHRDIPESEVEQSSKSLPYRTIDDDDLYRSEEVIDLSEVSANSQRKQRKQLLESSDDDEAVEQVIQLNILSKQGVREALEFQMRIFDYTYDFEMDELAGGES